MLRQIKVTELCKELEEKLVGLQYSEDSLRRYRKVFREFEEYAGDCDYSAICAARRPLVRLPAATRRSPTATFIKVFR